MLVLYQSLVCKNIIDACFVFHLQVGNETSGAKEYAYLGCSNYIELRHHVATCKSAMLASSTVLRMLCFSRTRREVRFEDGVS